MTRELDPGRLKVALAGMVVAPVLLAGGLLWSATVGPYLLGIPAVFGAVLLIQLSNNPAAAFGEAHPSSAAEPPWYLGLTPAYFDWASEVTRVPGGFIKWTTWLAWCAPAGLFVFLVIHAVIDFVSRGGGG